VQNFVTNNVFLDKKVKTQQQQTRALSQDVTNAPDCRYDTGLGAQCVKTA